MSEALLENVLYGRCGLPPSAVVNKTARGKKFVDSRYKTEFSVTDTGGLWMCSVSDMVNGIDAEFAEKRVVSDPEKLSSRFMTEEERVYIGGDNRLEGRKERLIYIWTRKEAYLKYTGEGLAGIKRSPSVVGHIESADLRTYRIGGALVSVCSETGGLRDDPRFVCIDLDGA